MDQATQTYILISLVGLLLMGLTSIVWFGVKRFVRQSDENNKRQEMSNGALKASIDGLKLSIRELRVEFVTQAQHRDDLAELRRHAFGRRDIDHCLAPDCPYEVRPSQPLDPLGP